MIIIILGAGVDEKGRLSKETVKRLEEAHLVYKKSESPLLLSGKYNFVYKKRPEFTEAEVMKDYLLKRGVKEDNIILDKDSEDTISSAYFAKTEVLLPKKEKEAVVVTSDIHLERVEYVFYKVFGDEYSLNFIGTLSKLPCQVKGMVFAKQHLLTQRAKEILDDVEEGDHEKVKEKVLSSDFNNTKGINLTKNIPYKKTC